MRCQSIIIMQYNFSINTRCFYSMKHVCLSNLSAFIYHDSDNCLSLEMTDRWDSRHTRSPSESLIFRKRDRSGPFTFDLFRDSRSAPRDKSRLDRRADRVYRIRGAYFQISRSAQEKRGRDRETKEDAQRGNSSWRKKVPERVWFDGERLDAFIGPRAIARAV